jgi:hypothetical protein
VAAPLDDSFHPDDPTKWLWLKLLRHRPLPNKSTNPKTKKEKNQIAQAVRQYYVDRVHPRKGKPFGK